LAVAKRRSSVDIEAELKVIQDELVKLADVEGTDEEVKRALDRSNEMLVQFDELKTELDEARDFEKKVDAVRSLALNPGNREAGDGSDQKYLGGSGPQVQRKVDPFDVDPHLVHTLGRSDVISRAMAVIDREKRVPISDENKAHLDWLIHRSEDQEDTQFDGSYVARRTILTENPLYRSAFRKYMRFGVTAAYTADEQRAISAYQDYEVRRAASENTTTAGGFGVPVKLAA
jgi:hypothetical protein